MMMRTLIALFLLVSVMPVCAMGRKINAKLNGEFVIDLTESGDKNGSWDYWNYIQPTSTSEKVYELLSMEFVPALPIEHYAGTRRFLFKAIHPGTATINFERRRLTSDMKLLETRSYKLTVKK